MAVYDDSKFNVWRACIGIIWIDGIVQTEERDWIEDRIEKLRFTDEQREILKQDLANNINFEEVFSKITRPADRGFLVHQIRVISHMDSDFSPKERALLQKWNDFVMKRVDMDEVLADITQAQAEHDEEMEAEQEEEFDRHSFFDRLIGDLEDF